jgi:hypothetical protein
VAELGEFVQLLVLSDDVVKSGKQQLVLRDNELEAVCLGTWTPASRFRSLWTLGCGSVLEDARLLAHTGDVVSHRSELRVLRAACLKIGTLASSDIGRQQFP